VEDEEILRRPLEQVLRLEGYVVLVAAEAEGALRLCEDQPVDLVLTDVVLPGMSGRGLAERALALHPELKILFMSGYPDEVALRHGVQNSEVAFLQKPFKPSDLARQVRQMLNTSRSPAPSVEVGLP
jgi:two-component system, cell cycle sensor histidine kinase and response regulator CckA